MDTSVCPSSRAFWGVMAAFLVHGLVVSTWVSRIAAVKTALGFGDGTLGLALLGAAVGSVTAIPICGALVTRLGSRRVAIWTSFGFALALVPLALAGDLTGLVLALVFYGLMAGANDVAMNAQAVGTENLLGEPTISRFHAMFSFGGILGAGAGVVTAHALPTSTHLIAGAALCVAVAAIASRLMVETPTKQIEHAPRRVENRGTDGCVHGEATRRFAGRWRLGTHSSVPWSLVALSAIGFCIFLSEGAIADWTAVYLKQVLRASDTIAPAGYAVFATAMALFRFTGDAITMRLGRAWTVRLGSIIAACGMAVVVAAQSPYWALAGFAAAGAGYSSIIPLVFAAGGRIPSVSEGVGVATVSGLGYLGFLVGPPMIGFISELSSLRAGLGVLVGLAAVAAVLVSVAFRPAQGSGGAGLNRL